MVHKELVIEHYGVKGMKWGVRKAVDRAKASGRMGINTYVHPVATTKVALKNAKTRPSSLIYNSTKDAKKFNSDVRKEVDRSKQLKADKKKNVQSAVALKSKVPSGSKRRTLSNSELIYGAIGLFATPIGAAGMLTAVSIENRRRTKKIIKNALGSEVGNYSKSSLNKARKQLNKYGVVTIETSKGEKTYGYSGLPI